MDAVKASYKAISITQNSYVAIANLKTSFFPKTCYFFEYYS